MGVATTTTFGCDSVTPTCRNTSTDEGDVTWVSLSYRTTDGSSGVTDLHFCTTHDTKVIKTLRDLGLVPSDVKVSTEHGAQGNTTKKGREAAAKKAAKKTTRSR